MLWPLLLQFLIFTSQIASLVAVKSIARILGIIGVFASASLVTGVASAHPLLDDAVASYEDADVRGALRTFNLAARDADLSVEELLTLFEMRALVHHAMGNETAMLRDLERVAALRPSHRLTDLAPPPVREAYLETLEANGGTMAVELVLEEKTFEGKPFVVARMERVPKGLVHRISLQCRVEPDGRTVARTVQGTRARIPIYESGAYRRCTATAETRRGTMLFGAKIDGAPPAPKLPLPEATPATLEPQPSLTYQRPDHDGPTDEASKKKKKKWPWIVAVSAIAVAGGVTAGVLLSRRSSESQSTPTGLTMSW